MSKSETIMKLIEAGYTKAEIDAIMIDQETNTAGTTKEVEPSTAGVDSNATTQTQTQTTTQATIETASTVNDAISNAVLLTAINNLTQAIQEQNRNSITSDGNVNASTESVSDILAKTIKK